MDSLTNNHRMELLSRAYIQAVVGSTGINLSMEFDYGVDGTFRFIKSYRGKRAPDGYAIDFQTKASTNWEIAANHIIYDLEAITYNYLVERNSESVMPIILILFCMPKDQNEWVQQSEDLLSLRKCSYWGYLHGGLSNNERSVRIEIPRRQILTSESLVNMYNSVRNGTFQSDYS